MNKLQNDFTTPDQSKRLLELEVPEWTANWKLSKLVKDSHGQEPKDNHDWEVNRKDYTHIIVGFMKYDYLPCWSVGRLIEIFDICYNGKYHDSLILSMWMDIDSIILALSDKECIDFSKLEE